MRSCRDERVRANVQPWFCAVIGAICVLALAGCAKKHAAGAPITQPPHSASNPGARQGAPAPQSGETGLASWYGHPYDGRQAADGEIYDMETLVAAHRTLPFGTWVRVTNLGNAKTVDVRIIDRGPFVDGRIIDLSHAAAQKIDLIGPGIAQVRLDILSVPPPAVKAASPFYAVQVGAYADRARAEQVRSTMEQRYGTAKLVLRQGNPPLWRVLVGRESSENQAEQLEEHLGGELDHCFVVRLDNTSAGAAD
jgi:rare lipoprotein A